MDGKNPEKVMGHRKTITIHNSSLNLSDTTEAFYKYTKCTINEKITKHRNGDIVIVLD